MITVTRAQIEEEVRQRTDLPAYGTESPVTQAEITLMCERSLSRLAGILSEAYPEGYQISTASLATQAGVGLVSLPSDFERLLRVAWLFAGDRPEITLQVADVDNWEPWPGSWSSYNGWLFGMSPSYRVQGMTLGLFPTPDAIFNLKLWYVPSLLFTGGTPSVQLRQGWDDWLVCDVAVRVRQRQQKDYSDFANERDRIAEKINDQAQRDVYSPRTIRDHRTGIVFGSRRYRW